MLAQNIASAIALNYHEGYIEAWNLALQRQLPRNFTVEAAYVGNHTVRAPVTYSPLDFDRRHTFVQTYVYELPFGKGKPFLQSGVGRWILGDWQVNGVLSLMTGRPVTFLTTVNPNTPGSTLTPDQIGPVTLLHNVAGPGGSALWFDTSAFRQPLDADGKTPHFGNTGRNNLSGLGLGDLDLSLARQVPHHRAHQGRVPRRELELHQQPGLRPYYE